MRMKGKQSITLTNKLVMTTQIQLAIKLLQLNSLDLQKEIDEKIMTNPFLENEDTNNSTEVISEIPVTNQNFSAKKHEVNYFSFMDDNLTLNRTHIMGLCNEILNRKDLQLIDIDVVLNYENLSSLLSTMFNCTLDFSDIHKTFLETNFEGGRHIKRVKKI